jgi:pilus assembly protein Flp/PilA
MVAMQLWLHKVLGGLVKEEGAAAVEYGLLVGLIAIAIITTVFLLGGELNDLFEYVQQELADVPAAPAAT